MYGREANELWRVYLSCGVSFATCSAIALGCWHFAENLYRDNKTVPAVILVALAGGFLVAAWQLAPLACHQ
jgi:hypothetical protein